VLPTSRFTILPLVSTLPLLAALIACETPETTPDDTTPEVDNPSGDCVAEDDGSRQCYHSSAGSAWLPDCDAPLDRELWRVFAESEDSAYMIPRPDALGLEYGICDGADAVLADLFDRNGLCDAVADLNIVNHMPPADAIDIGHALHERLEFSAISWGTDTGWDITPFAPDNDRLDACRVSSDPVLDDVCADLETNLAGEQCPELYVNYATEEIAAAMAEALNQLYGI